VDNKGTGTVNLWRLRAKGANTLKHVYKGLAALVLVVLVAVFAARYRLSTLLSNIAIIMQQKEAPMKKAIVAALVVVLLTSGLVVGCQGVAVKGSGNLATENYNLSDFTRVEAGTAFEVEVVQSGSYSVEVTVDDNLFKYVDVSKAGETLKIGLTAVTLLGPTTLKAKVAMPELRGLDLSGATRGTVSGFSSTENLDIEVSGASSVDLVGMSAGDAKFEVSGAGKVTGDITAADTEFDVSGASTVQLEGSAGDIVVEASGASRVKLVGFTVSNADVTLGGASTGTVNLDGRLNANLSGASKLSYIGEPTMGTINTSGGSTLSKK